MNALWYPSLLGSVVKPVATEFPDQDFFFSKYVIWYGEDDGDTDCMPTPDRKLPPNFEYTVQGRPGHRSVRLRFRENATFENRLRGLLDSNPDHYLYSDIRTFGFEGDIGGERFAPHRERTAVLRRSRLVATLLCANSRIILDALVQDGNLFRFEKNEHALNQPLKSTFISVGHMITQAYVDYEGNNLPIFILLGLGPL